MPTLFYIKYFDGTLDFDHACPFQTEFFIWKYKAEERRDELLAEIKAAGGSDKAEMMYEGGIGEFNYRCRSTLMNKLDELNLIYST